MVEELAEDDDLVDGGRDPGEDEQLTWRAEKASLLPDWDQNIKKASYLPASWFQNPPTKNKNPG